VGLAVAATLAVTVSACDERRDRTASTRVASRTDTLPVEPAVRVGGPEATGAASFARIVRVLVGPDDRVFALDAGRSELQVFERSGVHARTIGRRGAGPGEFSDPSAFGFVGDTIWVHDWPRSVTHHFALDGAYLLTTERGLALDSTRFRGSDLPIALLEGNGGLFEATRPRSTLPPDAVGPVVYVAGPSGARDTLVTRAVWRGQVPVPGVGTLRVPALPDHPLVAVDGLGRRIVVAEQPGADGIARVAIHGPGGRRLVAVGVDGFSVSPVPAAVRDSLLAGATAALRRTMDRLPDVRRAVEDPEATMANVVRVPERMPALALARVMRDGTVWLQLTPSGSRDREWLVLDTEGVAQRVVVVPAGFEVHDADGSHVWGVMRDSLDVDHLVGFELDPRSAGLPGM
jgi:hypothetical protein